MAKSELVKKLHIQSGQRIAILHAPAGYLDRLGELPADVKLSNTLDDTYDLIQAFYTAGDTLLSELDPLKAGLADKNGILWISYRRHVPTMEGTLARLAANLAAQRKDFEAVEEAYLGDWWTAIRLKQVD